MGVEGTSHISVQFSFYFLFFFFLFFLEDVTPTAWKLGAVFRPDRLKMLPVALITPAMPGLENMFNRGGRWMAQGSDVQDRRYWANVGLPTFPPSTSDIISTHLERSSPSFPWILFFCHKRKIIEIETTSPNSLTILNLKCCQVAAWELLKGL